MIKIHAKPFKEAGKLLKRLPFTRSKLPVFTHLAAYAENGILTLVAATLDQRLETKIPLAEPIGNPESFLIPHDAFRSAMKADKDSIITIAVTGARKRRTLQLIATCKGIPVETRHPTENIADFPESPTVEGPSALIPARTIEMLAVVAPCASTQDTRPILNSVLFTPEDGGLLIATDGRRLAGAPATVPGTQFILPNQAVSILTHPDFGKRSCTVTVSEQEKDHLVCFQSDA